MLSVIIEPFTLQPFPRLTRKFRFSASCEYTRTQKAISILANWDEMVQQFLTVIPRDYKRVLPAIQNALASGLSGDRD
jgi:glutamate synthase domain-containing protein 3